MTLYFNAAPLPPTTVEYVTWIDVMGTQSSMSRSLKVTANFVFKLHIAALSAPHGTVKLYPVMDGLYAACPDQTAMLSFLRAVMTAAAEEFNTTADNQFRFIVRGGLAFGQVYHGSAVPAAASTTLAANAAYRDCILLGMPMVQAHLCEASAPPFGIYVHESARSSSPPGIGPLHQTWWRWDSGPSTAVWSALQASLTNYFAWCAERSLRIGYADDRIAAHKKMFEQYFA